MHRIFMGKHITEDASTGVIYPNVLHYKNGYKGKCERARNILHSQNVMRSRVSLRGTFFLILQVFVAVSSNSEDETKVRPNSTKVDEHKILLECQHPDYRTYIKCLKRQKRHHWPHDEESDFARTVKCSDECDAKLCETPTCAHCHKHCMKITKETRIVQYETTCISGDCTEKPDRKELPTTNITTNIDINNIIHNHMPKWNGSEGNNNGKEHPGGGGGGGGTIIPGGGSIVPGPGGGTPMGPSNWPCSPTSNPPCNNGRPSLIPQISLVPQLTFGFDMNSFGGRSWSPQFNGIDCSPCGNPLMHYRCDVSCYNTQKNPCTSPQCVGGT